MAQAPAPGPVVSQTVAGAPQVFAQSMPSAPVQQAPVMQAPMQPTGDIAVDSVASNDVRARLRQAQALAAEAAQGKQ